MDVKQLSIHLAFCWAATESKAESFDFGERLGVAEGIETALSLAHAFEPVWSVIDAGNLAALPVLGGVECLLIAADNDLAGIKAANECALRWNKEGVEVRITQQPQNDLNDALLEAA